ncbi:MAG TPA: hypothetical protein VGF55_11495 [Gemmataceae bacterium]|jgi:hypothetical protein
MRTLLCVLTIGLLPVALAGCNKPKAKPSVEEPAKPVAKLTADELADEYKKNQIGADQKYKDKLIQVTGKVSDIGKLPLAGYYIDLASSGEGDLFGIKCILDKDDKAAEEKAGKLKAGDTITIAGRCEGKAAGQALYLRYCYFP